MRVCEICGATSEETRVHVSKKFGMTLCRKHILQMSRHGKVYSRTMYDPNEIHTNKEYSEIVLYDKNCEEIGTSKIDTAIIPAIKDRKWYLRPNGYTYGVIPLSSTKMKLHAFVYEYFTGG